MPDNHDPRTARVAVAAARHAAAGRRAIEKPGKDLPVRLRRFVRDSPECGLATIGATEAAERLEVSRTTIYDWARKGTLLAWRAPQGGLRIPAAQILGPRKVIPGLPEILDAIGDPELAWAFLTQEWPFEDETAVPLRKLKAGQVREVVDAAPGFGATFS